MLDGSDDIDVGAIHAIVLNEAFLDEAERQRFTVAPEDWTRNPTMGVLRRIVGWGKYVHALDLRTIERSLLTAASGRARR